MSSFIQPRDRILLIRMSAMGDIIHTLPAAATLKTSFPGSRLAWLVAPRWMPLLEGNPYIDEVLPLDRSSLSSLTRAWRAARAFRPRVAFDFQGLLQSAIIGRATKPEWFFGFDKGVAREPLAASFYTHRVAVRGPHRVQRNVQLAEYAGATEITHEACIPAGSPEGHLPSTPFVLTSPFAGWAGKEWPLEFYDHLGSLLRREGLELVVNASQHRAAELQRLKNVQVHVSSISGLIHATRRAEAIVGLDSGPVHLAAALKKPGVALYGPTDPVCTGPFGDSFEVLRTENAETTYKRHGQIQASMKKISAEQVADALLRNIAHRRTHALVSRP
jgi:heptosyltransferase-1